MFGTQPAPSSSYDSMDQSVETDPEEFHPPLSPASGAESLFLAGLTTSFSPDDLSKQLRNKNYSSAHSASCSVSLNTAATDDFMSAVGNVDDLDEMMFNNNGTTSRSNRFSIPEEDYEDQDQMNAFKKSSKETPTKMPPKEPMTTTTTTTESPDAAEKVYEGAKGVWAWGKSVPVFSPFMGVAEAVAGKALEVAGTNLEGLDGAIKPQLASLDSGVLNPAIAKVTEVMLGAAGKAEEIVKPIIVLVLSPFKMLEQSSDETPEVTN